MLKVPRLVISGELAALMGTERDGGDPPDIGFVFLQARVSNKGGAPAHLVTFGYTAFPRKTWLQSSRAHIPLNGRTGQLPLTIAPNSYVTLSAMIPVTEIATGCLSYDLYAELDDGFCFYRPIKHFRKVCWDALDLNAPSEVAAKNDF